MFRELEPIVKSTMIQILISSEGDKMRVMVMPKAVEGQNPALSAPLSLLGTSAELDEKLPEILTNYTECRQSLEDSLANVKLVMDAAKQDAMDKAKAKPAPAKSSHAKSAGNAISVDFANDDEENDGVDLTSDEPFEPPVASSTIAPSPKSQDTAELDLFS
jgi:PRTRC genetic system protein E